MSTNSLQAGISGLQAQAKKMDVIGDNLANINTIGFNKSDITFREAYADTVRSASSGDGKSLGGTNPSSIGQGVQIGSINRIVTQGAKIATQRTLDFMIEGSDYFVAKNVSTGEVMLTRNGSFQQDGNGFIVDSLGNKILGFNVDRETGVAGTTATALQLPQGAIQPHATSKVVYADNIDSSTTEANATADSNAWELFSAGENFGHMSASRTAVTGLQSSYGSGYYQDSVNSTDSTATLAAGKLKLTLGAAVSNIIQGFKIGDTISIRQGTEQVTRVIADIDSTADAAGTLSAKEISFTSALPAGFSTGSADIEVTNLSRATSAMGRSGSSLINNDILKSQVSMVDQFGNILASFYRVSGTPKEYTHATATTATTNTSVTVGIGEFSNMEELKSLTERVLRDTQLTNFASSSDLKVGLDKFGRVSYEGAGLVKDFRLVMNADNTEMLDRFSGMAVTDNGATAITQARIDANGKIMEAGGSSIWGTRTVDASKQWFDTAGLPNYGYSSSNPSTEYGDFAGLRLDSNSNGLGFGTIQVSAKNALGNTVTREFKLVARNPESANNEFSTMGELANLIQGTLRSSEFSSLATDGVLVGDQTASASFTGGRLSVGTSAGSFSGLTIKALNTGASIDKGVLQTDDMNFGTLLGELRSGVSGKGGVSNRFIQADTSAQTRVYDSLGNEHTTTTYFVRDRSSGLTNVEWKFKTGLNPNANTFVEDPTVGANSDTYQNTFGTLRDTNTSRGVLAFDITTGKVLDGQNGSGDVRYKAKANINFTSMGTSQESAESDISIDFANMTSFNGRNSVVGRNEDGFGLGTLIRLGSEQNTGVINGVYSNGQIRPLARIGLMHIQNPEGLAKVGSSYYAQTSNSGPGGVAKGIDMIFSVGGGPKDNTDGVNSRISGNALEGSNVDLTEELTSMIVAQRSYSASGKIITTSDDMLQETLSLKR